MYAATSSNILSAFGSATSSVSLTANKKEVAIVEITKAKQIMDANIIIRCMILILPLRSFVKINVN
jgi:hypothetical protein